MRCSDGHDNENGQRFCGECGIPLPDANDLIDSFTYGPSTIGTQATEKPSTSSNPDLRRGLLVLGLIVLVLVGIRAFQSGDGGSSAYTIRGIQTLTGGIGDQDVRGPWDDCEGTGGYRDIGPGTNVSVVDAEGVLIGTGTTESINKALLPELVALDRATDGLGLDSRDPDEAVAELQDSLESFDEYEAFCVLWFEVDVPRSDFYTVEIGRRGDLDYSFAEMEDKSFYIATGIGS